MKKLILPLTIAAIMTFGCATEKPAGTTILSLGTPWYFTRNHDWKSKNSG